MRKIALWGFNSLEEAGLRGILESIAACKSFPADIQIPEVSDRYDGYIVSEHVFALNLEFFLSRQGRTCVLCEGDKEINGEGRPLRIGIRASYDVLAESIGRFCDGLNPTDYRTTELSNRERDVLRELASGKTNKEIADTLFISVHTVITHRKNISEKLGVKSISGLSLYALMNGLIEAR